MSNIQHSLARAAASPTSLGRPIAAIRPIVSQQSYSPLAMPRGVEPPLPAIEVIPTNPTFSAFFFVRKLYSDCE